MRCSLTLETTGIPRKTWSTPSSFAHCVGPMPRVAARRHDFALTVTFTYPFVQQHWNPSARTVPGPPESSQATTLSIYSPGSLNVAVVTAFPPSTGGVVVPNCTRPGPRYLLQTTPS